MDATVLNCTLKPSPAESNTEALARVVIDALEEHGVETELIRIADHDGAHHVIAEVATGLVDIASPSPGRRGRTGPRPGPGPSYLETDEGKEWSHTTGKAAAGNLVAVAGALAERPMGPPAS